MDRDVVTAADAGMIHRQHEDHLHLATVRGRALYSFKVGDFHEIHTAWTGCGRNHCCIVLTQQQRYSTGEQIRRLLRLIGSLSTEAIACRLELISPPWPPRQDTAAQLSALAQRF